MLGTVAAVLIFAESLFEPRLSLTVWDSTDKSNLIWMIIGLVPSAPRYPAR
jgi:hypothetical protein